MQSHEFGTKKEDSNTRISVHERTRTVNINETGMKLGNDVGNHNQKVTRLPANRHRNSERCVSNHVQIK